MKLAKIVALLGLLAMTVVLIYGFTMGDFFEEGRLLLTMPWGIVSLVDLYVGFTLFSGFFSGDFTHPAETGELHQFLAGVHREPQRECNRQEMKFRKAHVDIAQAVLQEYEKAEDCDKYGPGKASHGNQHAIFIQGAIEPVHQGSQDNDRQQHSMTRRIEIEVIHDGHTQYHAHRDHCIKNRQAWNAGEVHRDVVPAWKTETHYDQYRDRCS